MSEAVSLAVAGAGLIGRRHVAAIAASLGAAELHSIVDPSPAARDYAGGLGAAWSADLAAVLGDNRADGVILATPNALHVSQGLDCVAAGMPVLVEKPVAVDVASAEELVTAGEAADVPILVGHHRRHNPLIAAAKAQIDAGVLGEIVAVQSSCWLMKPDDYFDTPWRREAGGGPVLVNLIHDIDLLRHLCGEIVSVQAQQTNAIRGHAVEETAVALLRFDNGALGTITLSDTIVAPWSWELTAAENPHYPATGQNCYQIGGTLASLELPSLKIWRNPGARSWREPISASPVTGTVANRHPADPLVRQIRHFAEVVRGNAQPLVSGREGLKTLAVIEAIKQSARSGRSVVPGSETGSKGS